MLATLQMLHSQLGGAEAYLRNDCGLSGEEVVVFEGSNCGR